MTEDVIRDVTAEFIRSSQSNLKLALEVERAMPSVREHYIREVLKAVEKRFPDPDWGVDRSKMHNVMAKNASLRLSSSAWKTSQGDAAIWLGSDQSSWSNVWIGLYFTGEASRKDPTIEQKLNNRNRGFKSDTWQGQPGVYKYLEGELRNWSGRQFLTRIISDDDGLDQIAKEISAELEELDKFVGDLSP